MTFEKVELDPREVDRVVSEALADFKHRPGFYLALGFKSAPEVGRYTREKVMEGETFVSDEYTACVYPPERPNEHWPPITHVTLKRNDREPIRDWRELQRIKNALFGDEAEAVELFPAESRKVDSANQYHLFVLPVGQRWPFGFTERLVTDDPGVGRARQRGGAL